MSHASVRRNCLGLIWLFSACSADDGSGVSTPDAGGKDASAKDTSTEASAQDGEVGLPDSSLPDAGSPDVAAGDASPGACGTMITIPAGEFLMGCNGVVDKECYQKEKPGHTVTLSTFEIDACEVTTAEYRSCVTAGACTVPKNPCVNPNDCTSPKMCNFHTAGRDAHPINCVMWGEADSYCKWVGKRLPTEAEWEKAARGSDGRKYPWGNDPLPSCERAVIDDNGALVPGGEGCSTGGTMIGGGKPAGASPYGVHDTLGNVWEWVSDWYAFDYFATSPAQNPQGPATGTTKVYKGDGWWDAQDRFLRLSFRTDETLHYKRNNLGFRCAR